MAFGVAFYSGCFDCFALGFWPPLVSPGLRCAVWGLGGAFWARGFLCGPGGPFGQGPLFEGAAHLLLSKLSLAWTRALFYVVRAMIPVFFGP